MVTWWRVAVERVVGGGDNDDVLHDCDDEKHEGDGHDVVFLMVVW